MHLLFLVRPFFIGDSAARQHFCQTPVHHLDFAKRADHDVCGFEITMNHFAAVSIGHRLTDLLKDANEPSTVLCGRFALGKQAGKCFTFDQLHAEEWSLIGKLP